MRNIYVISDTHFNHANILKFTDDKGKIFRPFSSVDEMNETMVENWNAVVRDQDIIYHLGDVYLTGGASVNQLFKRLRGRKRWIIGNHDNPYDQMLRKHFQKAGIWRVWKEEKLIFSHVPIHESSLRGFVNVHGHIHQNESPPGPYVNVCVEKTDWGPVSIDTLVANRSWCL